MSFKTPLCIVMCLVITTMLHSTTAWQQHITAKETVVNKSRCDVQIEQLEAAIMKKVLELLKNHTSPVTSHRTIDDVPFSCATLKNNATGTYSIRPAGAVESFQVRCDFEDNYELGGGWTVFQHRYDGSVDFYRNWTMYKDGFGDVNAEHWLGLEKLHVMTKSGKQELLIIMEDFVDGHSYAQYKDLKIGSEDEKYKLTVGNYSGTAGDSLKWHNGMKFSTFDQQNDAHVIIDCAEKYHGAWWYNDCYDSNLNGEYLRRGKHITDESQGVKWNHWKGAYYSLKSTKMMLRRR